METNNEPKQPTASAMSQHLRTELIRILQEGDPKYGGAFTVAVAAHVEKFLAAAREILMTETLAQHDIASLLRARGHHMSPFGVGSYLGSGALLGGLDNNLLPSPTINNENFGVQAIRQVVDAIRSMNESPTKLVEALAVARENGLDDVVAVLEKKLGLVKPDVAEMDGDPILDVLRAALDGHAGRLRVADAHLICGIEPGNATNEQIARVGRALRSLGWERQRVHYEGEFTDVHQHVYVRGTGTERDIPLNVAFDPHMRSVQITPAREDRPLQ